MIRRPLRPVSRLVAVVSVSIVVASCSAIPSTNDAFRVNGTGYSNDKFNAVIEALATGEQFKITDGKVNSDTYSTILRTLVRYESYRQWATDIGLTESAADKAAAKAKAESSQDWNVYPDALRELVVNLNTADLVMARAQVPAREDLKAMYERAPASTGAMCMSHIIVATKAEADRVIDRLDAGEKFADVAKDVSIEPAAKESGGSLGMSPTNPCQRIQDAQLSLDGDFMTAAVNAKTGVPTGPVKTSFGWHVIVNRPFDEIEESLRETISEGPGVLMLSGWMTTADIEIDSKFGYWNTARGVIE